MRKKSLKNKLDKKLLQNKAKEGKEDTFFIKKIKIDAKDHTKQAVNMAVYSFLDDYYIKIENLVNLKNKKALEKSFLITFEAKGKNTLFQEKMFNLEKDFLNELVYCSIRENVSKRNKRIREAMVAQFLLSAVGGINGVESTEDNESLLNAEEKRCRKELEENFSGIENDPLGIAVSWEDAHKKEIKTNKK